MKAFLMRPIPPGSTRSVSTGSSTVYTDAALPVEITERKGSGFPMTVMITLRVHTRDFSRILVLYIYIYI